MSIGTGRGFTLDRFQLEAIGHLDAGRSVLVAAPTGSGKTVVAEHAIDRALAAGRRAFYTAPIKALSNQKFGDLCRLLGDTRVGLLTGDNTINGDADVVVMTTEVLRNMLYARRDLDRLDVVVLDEVHYLEDSYRGPVWEEVILQLPEPVKLVCLSATISNTAEVGGWLDSVRGGFEVVVEHRRPVELTNVFVVGDRRGDRVHVVPTLVDGRANPEAHRFEIERVPRRHDRRARSRPWRPPSHLELLDLLEERCLLPAIWFIFSRRGCDDAAAALVRAGVKLTTAEDRHRILAIAEDHLRPIDRADLAALDITSWMQMLERGVAAHHAGLVPAFKETVEACFAAGLVRVVFATETLALGVNLPARSVVIDKLTKFTGESHELLTPGQFTQLSGRAGRRGIDQRGTAVVPWSPFTSFEQVAALASSRSFELRSAFRPTYNMAANLLGRLRPEEARELLARSFAQYQTDLEVARIEQQLVRERRRVLDLEAALGSPALDDRAPAGTAPADIADGVARLRPGDVVHGVGGARLAVIGVSWRRGGRARVRLVDTRGADIRWDLDDLDETPRTAGRIELPYPLAPDRPTFRHDVAGRLRRVRVRGRRAARTERHGDRRGRLRRARAEVAALERRARRDEGSIARQFDSIADVMHERDLLDHWRPTESGALVARVYHELDLLVAESLTEGLLDGLPPAALASVVSCFTYEHRNRTPPPPPSFPSPGAHQRFRELERLSRDLRAAERRHGVSESREPQAGFAAAADAWVAGEELGRLIDDDLSAGDFVRNVKQLMDLLRQIASVAPVRATRSSAAAAAAAALRGVVALSGSLDRP